MDHAPRASERSEHHDRRRRRLNWLQTNHDRLVADLAALVKVPSISNDGDHQPQIEQTAELTCEQMRRAGLQNVDVLRTGRSNPYAYGEWLGATGKPTVFLYAHHDVQPVNDVGEVQWQSDPWTLTRRDGRLYGRGAADDKGAITAQLGAVSAYLQTRKALPVNVKMLVEGEEEIGSSNLLGFFEEHKKAHPVGRDRRLRHRQHRDRPAEHHLLRCAASWRRRWRCRAPARRSTAASPAGRWPTPPWRWT